MKRGQAISGTLILLIGVAVFFAALGGSLTGASLSSNAITGNVVGLPTSLTSCGTTNLKGTCPTGQYCALWGSCTPKLNSGQSCSVSSQCLSNICSPPPPGYCDLPSGITPHYCHSNSDCPSSSLNLYCPSDNPFVALPVCTRSCLSSTDCGGSICNLHPSYCKPAPPPPVSVSSTASCKIIQGNQCGTGYVCIGNPSGLSSTCDPSTTNICCKL